MATPLLLVLLLAVVQTALSAHASQVAHTIADSALAATRTLEGTETDGHAAAEQARAQLAGQMVSEVEVEVDRSATSARVAVSARAPAVLPGTGWPISREVSAPVERLTDPP
ncbi:pilus assembly protein [Nocardiopsis coralliicola]